MGQKAIRPSSAMAAKLLPLKERKECKLICTLDSQNMDLPEE